MATVWEPMLSSFGLLSNSLLLSYLTQFAIFLMLMTFPETLISLLAVFFCLFRFISILMPVMLLKLGFTCSFSFLKWEFKWLNLHVFPLNKHWWPQIYQTYKFLLLSTILISCFLFHSFEIYTGSFFAICFRRFPAVFPLLISVLIWVWYESTFYIINILKLIKAYLLTHILLLFNIHHKHEKDLHSAGFHRMVLTDPHSNSAVILYALLPQWSFFV